MSDKVTLEQLEQLVAHLATVLRTYAQNSPSGNFRYARDVICNSALNILMIPSYKY